MSAPKPRFDRAPAPTPPQDGDAWYAPETLAQYESAPGVVAAVSRRGSDGDSHDRTTEFAYDAREPPLSPSERADLDRVREHFADTQRRRPITRQGAVERAEAGFSPKYERTLDRLLSGGPGARRRLNYHALRELRLLGDATPLALDDDVGVADSEAAADGSLVVHTTDFAPAITDLDADSAFVDRVAAERLRRYEVEFAGYPVPVVVYRDGLLGSDRFATRYAVLEPDLLPGDDQLIAECKKRVWEASTEDVIGGGTDRHAFVADRARQLLSRRLAGRNTREWLASTRYRLRSALADLGVGLPPIDDRYAEDRLDDLVYHVLRDYVGEGPLTVPIRDPNLEDIEANRVGERVKVVPRDDIVDGGRVPTNLAFDAERSFVNVVTQLAAGDGVELNASNPSAKVNLDPPGVAETVRCAVALPTISEGGPHVSIRKQAAEAMTPVDLLRSGTLSTDLVALLWLCYEHRGIVLFSGPTGVGKTTLMNAHMPFVPFDDRPVSIDEGSREVRLPHETGVSLTTRDHESEYKRVTMADLMTESNYLNPDVEVIAEINTPESFETFAEIVNTGHGVVGTTHAEDVRTLVNRVVEQDLPAYLLEEIDLVVFPHRADGQRYVARAVEFLSPEQAERLPPGSGETIEKGDTEIHFNEVFSRDIDGSFSLSGPADPASPDDRGFRLLHRIATATDRSPESVEREFRRKRRYVEFLDTEGVTDFDALFDLLADLRTDEAATVERLQRTAVADGGDEGEQ
ncbi:type II/IV secretion system ATPase subunit [Halolamina salifodinae]|uniref:Type IV secretory pathway ATPase VirB11/archaellum biosynthesis ATPase n=1 Tax=Halolamina salifodinae TaxID=1202767 RepID=A0A8T4GU03_9EURY|nr:type II/IV secretion system ATPase subunit [Halolamina salifodinae]MBP1986346.1 type IV secretory pathway ATPase VirB11/archaellum biosynthesis ATPase [Halolamina salifodinae]